MTTTAKFLLSALLFVPLSFCAAQEKLEPLHAPDGGTIERFASISIPSMANAPFTANVNTQWIRHLPDGSNITLINHRAIARDAQGRVFEERRSFVPDDGKREPAAYQIEISDPVAHVRYVCRVAAHSCRAEQFSGRNFVAKAAVGAAAGQAPGQTVEKLGNQIVSGIDTVGSRETRVVQAATIGNEAPILERREYWYSAKLGINLITRREDPRFSTQQNFEVTDIALGDPDASLFAPPEGFKIIDLRKPVESNAATADSPSRN